MKKRKRAITLLEVMIALSLAAILLSVVFSTYRQITMAQVKLEKTQVEVLANKTLQQRLSQLFSHLNFEKEVLKDKKTERVPAIYTFNLPESKGLALILNHDNGIDPDPSFCNTVKSELYLSLKNELCLATYSSTGAKRIEILKSHVSELRFSFFEPYAEKPYLDSWEFNKEAAPPIVKLLLFFNKKDPPLTFAFFISEADEEIVYKKKGGMNLSR